LVLSNQKSEHNALIAIQKAGAIGLIIVTTALNVANAQKWLAPIPIIGPILAQTVATLLILWGAEQISNITGVSVDVPGAIGSVILQIILAILEILKTFIIKLLDDLKVLGEFIGGTIASIVNLTKSAVRAASGFLGAVIRLVEDIFSGDILTGIPRFALAVLNNLAALFGSVFDFASSIIKGLLKFIFNVIKNLVNFIGNLLDSLFGWLFAEGGMVTSEGQQSLVRPLPPRSELRLTVNATIRGGIRGTPIEAQQLANNIHGAIIRHGHG